jgi:UDP-N-acetyl-2-amino-2-deoxyglucuronate dehydrogenase
MNKKNFILVGGAGYVSPRHVKAIKDLGHNLIAMLDPNDSVGFIDGYFPKCDFFTEFERFDRHVSKLIDKGTNIDYVVVCSPNYLHDSHCMFGLRIGADVICEKPLVLKEKNLDHLINLEKKYNKKIYTILQLRLNPVVQELKKKIEFEPLYKSRDISLIYNTYRGPWYLHSWKNNIQKSGGLFTNIGIHLADILLYLFLGEPHITQIYDNTLTKVSGHININNNNIYFELSIEEKEMKRELTIDGESIELSVGFSDAHQKSYNEILNDRGFGIEDARKSIRLAERVRELCK